MKGARNYGTLLIFGPAMGGPSKRGQIGFSPGKGELDSIGMGSSEGTWLLGGVMAPGWEFGLLGVVGVALVTDLKSRKIYNWLTFPAMLAGLVGNAIAGGLAHGLSGAITGAETSLTGLVAGTAIFALGFFMGAMGAGDVKLMAAIGLWMGFPGVVPAVVYVAATGGVVAIAAAAANGALAQMFRNVYGTMIGLVTPGGAKTMTLTSSAAPPVPYGVSIAIGTALALFFPNPGHLFGSLL